MSFQSAHGVAIATAGYVRTAKSGPAGIAIKVLVPMVESAFTRSMRSKVITGKFTATVHKETTISAAHFLPMHEGKCRFLHGHNYRVEVWASGEPETSTGMFLDFDDMERDMSVIEFFDHKFLNDLLDMPTTAENLARYWLERLHETRSEYWKVRVWETDKCYAEVEWEG